MKKLERKDLKNLTGGKVESTTSECSTTYCITAADCCPEPWATNVICSKKRVCLYEV